ncbi:MAG: contractile injection system tape measure protein, partial [Bacteroidota bacterium]
QSDRQTFFALLWPGMGPFVNRWINDVGELLSDYSENISKLAIERSIWNVFLDAGRSGLDQVALVSRSGTYWSKLLKYPEEKLWNDWYRLAQTQAPSLQLQGLVAKLIERAVQTKLFIRLQTPHLLARRKNKGLTQSWTAVMHYFEQGQLLPGQRLEELKAMVEQLLEQAPRAFRLWLNTAIQDDAILKKACLFFSASATVRILNTFASEAGTHAMNLLKVLQASSFSIKNWYRGTREKKYWQLIWLMVRKHLWQGFHLRFYLQEILQEIAQQQYPNLLMLEREWQEHKRQAFSQLQARRGEDAPRLVDLLFDCLTDSSLSESNVSTPLLQSVIRSQQYFLPTALVLKKAKGSVSSTNVTTDFSKLNAVELLQWLRRQLKTVASVPAVDQRIRLEDFTRHLLTMSPRAIADFWPQFSDAMALSLLEGLLSQDELLPLLDVIEVVGQAAQQNAKAPTRFFSWEWSALLLNALLNNRGSMSNQETFIRKLLKDWAKAHGWAYEQLLRSLWPLVWELNPIFRSPASLNILTAVLRTEMDATILAQYTQLEEPASKDHKTTDDLEQKPYRKLWEMEETLLEMEQVWVVHNAGLVILWPYLNALFNRAGFMEEN